jgi:DNA polymerase-3 subunit delta'
MPSSAARAGPGVVGTGFVPGSRTRGLRYHGGMAKRVKAEGAKGGRGAGSAVAERPAAAAPVAKVRGLGEIIGQERAIATIRAAIRSGRLHHAWIFHGPEGVGKFTTAVAFASLILDPTAGPGLSGEIEAERGSRVQRLIEAGQHPDLHIITKELARFSEDRKVRDAKLTSIAKDVVRTHLLDPAALGSAMKGGLAQKVFIVDEAELLDRSAGQAFSQNALLKTLEEPAPGTVIILVTSHPERLLPTIRSRSQQVAFGPLSEAAMQQWVRTAGREAPELAGLDDAARRWVLSFTAGSPGQALMAARTGLHAWHEKAGPMLEDLASGRGGFPIALGQTMAGLVDEWAAAWVEAHPNGSKDAANRAAARLMLRMASEVFRGRLASSSAAERARALRAIELVHEAEREADANVQLPFVFESWAARVGAC